MDELFFGQLSEMAIRCGYEIDMIMPSSEEAEINTIHIDCGSKTVTIMSKPQDYD